MVLAGAFAEFEVEFDCGLDVPAVALVYGGAVRVVQGGAGEPVFVFELAGGGHHFVLFGAGLTSCSKVFCPQNIFCNN